MKTQLAPNSFREVLARDSLKNPPERNQGNQMFTVLYDLVLYVMMPIAFEMSYVKIFQSSMKAYHVNDTDAMSRLIAYFAIQWFLGALVRRDYLKATLKRVTLAVLILIQIKEVFFEEVLLDMLLSFAMESGLMVVVFFKFAHLVVVLKMVGLGWVLTGTLLAIISNRLLVREMIDQILAYTKRIVNYFMYRIHICMNPHAWKGSYC